MGSEQLNALRQKVNEYNYLMVVVIMVLMFLAYTTHGRVSALETFHADALEGAGMARNPYANDVRYQTYLTDGGGGTQSGGNSFDQSSVYSSHKKGGETFLGGGEPPVLYDIGSVRQARALRSRHGLLRDAAGNPVLDAQGNTIRAKQTSAERIAEYGYNVNATGAAKSEPMWAPVSQEGMWAAANPEGMTDDQLLALD